VEAQRRVIDAALPVMDNADDPWPVMVVRAAQILLGEGEGLSYAELAGSPSTWWRWLERPTTSSG
jgi:hypothetical protein